MKRKACCVLGRGLLVLILTLLWIAPASADEKTLLAAIDEQAGNCKVVSAEDLRVQGTGTEGVQEFAVADGGTPQARI